ncbi:alcohol dehydrogenase catalytic domain-containing protein [Rhodococcus sp. C26F]
MSIPSTPPPGEVLVRLKASGLCHSDLHVIVGEGDGVPSPMILGHEGAGIVEAVGDGVADLETGDHIVLSWTPSCGRCWYCISGRPVLCDKAAEHSANHVSFDGGTRITSSNGESVHSFAGLGTFGEYALLPRSAAIAVDRAASFEQPALVGCAVTTEIGAVVNTAAVRPYGMSTGYPPYPHRPRPQRRPRQHRRPGRACPTRTPRRTDRPRYRRPRAHPVCAEK